MAREINNYSLCIDTYIFIFFNPISVSCVLSFSWKENKKREFKLSEKKSKRGSHTEMIELKVIFFIQQAHQYAFTLQLDEIK